MKISATMVKALLGYVTSGYFDDHEDVPAVVTDIAEDARNMRIVAEQSGDLPWLKLALAHLLSDPAASLAGYGSFSRRLTEEEMGDLLMLIWQGLWPDEPIPEPGAGPDIELEQMEADDWLAYRSEVYGS